jgi:hypothetical protein
MNPYGQKIKDGSSAFRIKHNERKRFGLDASEKAEEKAYRNPGRARMEAKETTRKELADV